MSPFHAPNHLAHVDLAGVTQHVTFRLIDSIPVAVIDRWKAELEERKTTGILDDSRDRLAHRIERYLDGNARASLLAEPANARIVADCFKHDHGKTYDLHAWCVMPNHGHVAFTPYLGVKLADIVQAWKSVTSHHLNASLGLKGKRWANSYYARFMRDEAHFERTTRYIARNPVKACLVPREEEWRWSHAGDPDARLIVAGPPGFPAPVGAGVRGTTARGIGGGR